MLWLAYFLKQIVVLRDECQSLPFEIVEQCHYSGGILFEGRYSLEIIPETSSVT